MIKLLLRLVILTDIRIQRIESGKLKLTNCLILATILALKIFGGITKTQIPIEVPEDETRLSELEFIFGAEYQEIDGKGLEKEAKELMSQYNVETKKHKIKELNEKLMIVNEDSEEYEGILREIRDLQKT